MQKEHLIQQLTRYRRPFSQTEQSVSVKSGFGLYVDVIFHENGQITLCPLFKGYNPLSGFIRLSIKGQLVYNSLLYLVFSVVTGYVMYTTPPLIIFLSVLYAAFSVLWISWTVYYLLRTEADKRQITAWLDELPA